MSVSYDGNAIIPAPFLSVEKNLIRSEDGKVRRRYFTCVAKGKLVAFAGSPNSSGVFWTNSGYPPDETGMTNDQRLASFRNKIGAMTQLFGHDGKWYEVTPYDGSAPIKFHPTVKDIQFQDGPWFNTVDYTITMEATNVFFGSFSGLGGDNILEPEESWSVELVNEVLRTYRVSHTVSSQQRAEFDDNGNVLLDGWQVASGVVMPYVGTPISGPLVPAGFDAWVGTGYGKAQTVDKAQGRFSITENWLYVYGQRWTEEFSVNTHITEDRTAQVTVEGTITGYADPATTIPADISSSKFDKAWAQWSVVEPQLLARSQNYSGITLNPKPLSKTTGANPITGIVTYNYQYDDRPPSLIAGSISETIAVNTTNPADVFASIMVVGRPAGPITQPIGSKTGRTKSVSIEAVLVHATYSNPNVNQPNTDGLIATFAPAGWYKADDKESWVARNGRYSRNVAWTENT